MSSPHFPSSCCFSLFPLQPLAEPRPSRACAALAPDAASGRAGRARFKPARRGRRMRGVGARAPWRRAAAVGSARWRSACPSSSASSSPHSKELLPGGTGRDGGGWRGAAANPRGRPAGGQRGSEALSPCDSRVGEGSAAPAAGTASLPSSEPLLARPGCSGRPSSVLKH